MFTTAVYPSILYCDIYQVIPETMRYNHRCCGMENRTNTACDAPSNGFINHTGRQVHQNACTRKWMEAPLYPYTKYIIKIKIHSSCEIEDFVETHLCKLCVILRSRVLRVVCPH